MLDTKALKLMGGAAAPPVAVPNGRNATAFFLEGRTADIFLLYCSGASSVQRELPSAVAAPGCLG